jgi:hypothetical protein
MLLWSVVRFFKCLNPSDQCGLSHNLCIDVDLAWDQPCHLDSAKEAICEYFADESALRSGDEPKSKLMRRLWSLEFNTWVFKPRYLICQRRNQVPYGGSRLCMLMSDGRAWRMQSLQAINQRASNAVCRFRSPFRDTDILFKQKFPDLVLLVRVFALSRFNAEIGIQHWNPKNVPLNPSHLIFAIYYSALSVTVLESVSHLLIYVGNEHLCHDCSLTPGSFAILGVLKVW